MTAPCYAKRAMRGFTPEAIENVRQRYEDTEEKINSIAADFGVSTKTITTLAHKQGWALRKDRAPRGLPDSIRLNLLADQAIGATASSVPSDETASASLSEDLAPSANIASRLEQALEKELRKVEALRNEFGPVAHRSIEAERTARTLATLTETLFKVRRLREHNTIGATVDDDMPADINEFRCKLAQRMEAFVRSRVDGIVSADAGAADAAST